MFFEFDENAGYKECSFNPNLLIFKINNIYTWEICLKHKADSDGYPKRIGRIALGDAGFLQNATNLSWELDEDYRGQGILAQLLPIFLETLIPDIDGFAVKILKHNTKSFNLAIKSGFNLYQEDQDCYYLVK